MFVGDGNEYIVRFADPDGVPATLVVDDEDYAGLMNKGWTVLEEVRSILREPVTEEMFKQAKDRPTGGDEGYAHIHN